jgi:diguanylate cyclase (GGDEF)-like protein
MEMEIENILNKVDNLLSLEEEGSLDKKELLRLLKELRLACQHFKEQATIDFLTRLYNRRFFDNQLELAVEQARRDRVPFSLIIMDLDYFKKINDQFGHVTGDQVLQHVARLIKENARKVDTPARYGGEEFAILMPGTGIEGALSAARRIKRNLENSPLPTEKGSIKITASMGVGTYRPFSKLSATEFLEQVDHLLYLAKERGRNCIVHEDISLYQPSEGLSAEEKKALLNGVWNYAD